MAQKTRPGNAERGWNDPPMFLHSATSGVPDQPATPPRRTLLNKRVAHPGIFTGGSSHTPEKTDSGGLVSTGTPPPSGGLVPTGMAPLSPLLVAPCPVAPPTSHTVDLASVPPPGGVSSEVSDEPVSPVSGVILLPPATSTDIPKFTAPIIVPTMSPKDDSPITGLIATNPITSQPVNMAIIDAEISIPDFDNDEQLYHFVLTRLKKTCVSCALTVQPRVIDDINRKLEIFSNMWTGSKISYPVKSAMARLSTALHHRKCDIAHKIHLSLMMDYVSEVGTWMVGVKRLIQEARNVDGPLSPTDTTTGYTFNPAPLATDTTQADDSQSQANGSESQASAGDSNTVSPDLSNTLHTDNTPSTEQVTVTDNMNHLNTCQSNSAQPQRSNSPATIETTMIE